MAVCKLERLNIVMAKQNKNCQVPTPAKYVEQMLNYVGYEQDLWGKKVLENSCGEGNILIEIVKRYVQDALRNGYTAENVVRGLERDIVAYEIDPIKIDICIGNLNILLTQYDLPKVHWNIKNKDFLKSKEENIDFIVGNPPYITYHDLQEEERDYLKKHFTVCKKGRIDYCYAFMEASCRSLARGGRMIYLIPFSIFRNKFADGLRAFLRDYVVKIFDYSNIDVFPGITCSTAMIVCENQNVPDQVEYKNVRSEITHRLERFHLDKDGKKWIFEKNEEGNRRFGDYYCIHNSIATLYNKAFLFSEDTEEDDYYIVSNQKIEKQITMPAVSTKSNRAMQKGKPEQRIIFPYKRINGKVAHYTEAEFKKQFPQAQKYLWQFKEGLSNRKADKKAKWFEYGRSQALSQNFSEKLILPMVLTSSTKTFIAGADTIPYAGYFITVNPDKKLPLSEAKKVLESKFFFRYVEEVGTPTTISSYRISVHDISEYRF